jgi:hypothetical protein
VAVFDSFEVSMFDRRGNRLFDIPCPDLPEQVAFSRWPLVVVIRQTQFKFVMRPTAWKSADASFQQKGGLTVAFSHNGEHLACGDRCGVIFSATATAISSRRQWGAKAPRMQWLSVPTIRLSPRGTPTVLFGYGM